MRIEIKSAATFLSGLVRLRNHLDNGVLDRFRGKIEELLRHHYQQHWFPETPCKGSGYRCLRINHKMDPIILKAGLACGLNEASLRQLFPNELTLWVDPREVSYRIGENGSICVLYDGSSTVNRSSSDSTFSSGSTLERLTSCKESIRGNSWGCFTMDSRNVNLEQLAAYVSS